MVEQELLLISRDDIVATSTGKGGDKVFRALARLTRGGFRLLATAPQPDDWSRKDGDSAEDLLGQESIRRKLADAGGTLDGVYFVPRSSFTQKRNREDSLLDMMKRYSLGSENCYLYSSSRKFIESANSLGMTAVYLGAERSLITELKALLNSKRL